MNFYEDSSIELIFVTFVQMKSVDPLKVLSWQISSKLPQSFWILIVPTSSMFSWQVRVKQVSQVLFCALQEVHLLTTFVLDLFVQHISISMSSSRIHFMFPHTLTLVNTRAWNYIVHNKKTSKILVFKVIWYHHELACTLKSVVSYVSVYYSWNLLWWHSGCVPLGWSGSELVIHSNKIKLPMWLLV